MACCGLCRSKIKSTRKTEKNITMKKMKEIDMWIENIEGPYQPIILPSKPPDKPKTITNKEEIAEVERNDHWSDTNASTEQDIISQNDNVKSERQNLQYLSSNLSMSSHNSINNS